MTKPSTEIGHFNRNYMKSMTHDTEYRPSGWRVAGESLTSRSKCLQTLISLILRSTWIMKSAIKSKPQQPASFLTSSVQPISQ